MPLLQVVGIIVVVGVLLWLATTYIPMEPTIKKILIAVVVIALVLWLLQLFGLFDLGGITVGHRRR
jgi:hypothetical protein